MSDIGTNITRSSASTSNNGTALSMFEYLSKIKSIYEISKENDNRYTFRYMIELLKLIVKTPVYILSSISDAIRLDRNAIQQVQLLSTKSISPTSTGISSAGNSSSIGNSINRSSALQNFPSYMFQFEMNYFFSFYSLSCIFSALVLARINFMSTTTLNRRRRRDASMRNGHNDRRQQQQQQELNKTEKYSRFTCHLLVITLFVILMVRLFLLHGKYGNLNLQNFINKDMVSESFRLENKFFLKLCLLSLIVSDSVLLLVNNVYNFQKSSLASTDYTLFDLSLLFYSFDQFPIQFLRSEYMVIISYVLISQICIHSLEMLKKRKLWFKTSAVINTGYIGWLIAMIYNRDFASLSIIIKYTSIPKLASLFIIVLSGLSFFLTCCVMGFKNLEILQYYKFFKNLKSHLNFTGEEDFNKILLKLSLFLTNSDYSDSSTLTADGHKKNSTANPLLSNDLGDINVSKKLGISNKVDTFPEQMFLEKTTNDCSKNGDAIENEEEGEGESGDKKTRILNKLIQWRRFQSVLKILYKIPTIVLSPWKKYYNAENDTTKERDTDAVNQTQEGLGYVNINEMINETNYQRLLINPRIALFPDTDISGDYELIDDDEEEEEDGADSATENEEKDEEDDEDLKNEIADLLHLDDMIYHDQDSDYYEVFQMWMTSKKHQDANHTIMTRSKYLEINEPDILKQIIKEKYNKNTKEGKISMKVEAHVDADDSDSETELQTACVVCRTNLRNIILWPCKCLCVCDDCRVSLGVRGFNKCPCCRSDVEGFSKINNV